jgi:Alpha/beta hydrolase family
LLLPKQGSSGGPRGMQEADDRWRAGELPGRSAEDVAERSGVPLAGSFASRESPVRPAWSASILSVKAQVASMRPGYGELMTQFVLVHGTTQSPAGWERLADELRGGGHGVTAIDFSGDQPEWAVSDYARHAAAQAGNAAEHPVVVAHSGAGVLLPAIARTVSAAAAVWLAAYVPDLPGGTSMLDDIRAQRDAMFHPDWLGADPTSDPELALRFLFHDCDPRTRQWALGTLRLFNPGPAVYQHSPAALPAGISRAAVVPAADRTLRPEWMRRAVRQRLGIEPTPIDTGHCPHVSQPQKLADILTSLPKNGA